MSDSEGTAGDTSGAVMNRRALLRASGVVAGIAGIAGYAAAQAPAADAAAGDPVIIGGDNYAESTPTKWFTAADGPTLRLGNSGRGAPLRLHGQYRQDPLFDSGDLLNLNSDLQFAHDNFHLATVFTSYNASHLVPVMPFRAVDTRTTAGRANILNRSGNLDSSGRVIGGHTIEIDLGDEVFQGTAVFANLTVTQPVSGGYLTLWSSGARPVTSALNYSAGQAPSNFCVSGLSSDTLRLYARSTTHVVLDVVAFAVGKRSDVNAALLPPASALAGSARKAPAWHTSQNS
jgi:hypothetical protein